MAQRILEHCLLDPAILQINPRDGDNCEMHADCEREPITFPERIQSFGFLLAVTNNWVIERASANLSQFLGMEAQSAIGMLLDRVIPQPAMHHLRYRVAMPGAGLGIDRIFGLRLRPGGDLYDLAFHLSGNLRYHRRRSYR